MDLVEVKRVLRDDYQLYDGPMDEKWNTNLSKAIASMFRMQDVKYWNNWPDTQQVIAIKQIICKLAGINPGPIDGILGHLTDHAIAVYDAKGEPDGPAKAEESVPLTPPPNAAAKWPRQTPDRSEIIKFFGPVGGQQVRMQLPYTLYYGPAPLKTIGLHKLVKEPVRRVLERTLDHYGLDGVKRLRLDQFSGALNVRKITGGSAWSMHAWGIAFDFDAAHNGYTQHCRTSTPKPTFCGPEYKPWIQFWEDEGAVSLGKARDFDWMHFQFARL